MSWADPVAVERGSAAIVAWRNCVAVAARKYAKKRITVAEAAEAAMSACAEHEEPTRQTTIEIFVSSKRTSWLDARNMAEEIMVSQRTKLRQFAFRTVADMR